MSASSIVPPSSADVSSPIYTVPLVSWSRCSSNFEGEFHRCIKYSYIVSKTYKSGRGETILSTFYIYRSQLVRHFGQVYWNSRVYGGWIINFSLPTTEYCPFFDAKEEEEEKDGENLRRRERERGMKEEKKKKMARNLYTCDPGVRQDSWIMWPSKRERGVRAPTLISIIVEYRMEFTRGPKCSPKYFIIEIVPRWAIKLERTSLRRKERGGSLERCVASVSCTRTYTLLTWAPAKSPRQRWNIDRAWVYDGK